MTRGINGLNTLHNTSYNSSRNRVKGSSCQWQWEERQIGEVEDLSRLEVLVGN